MALPWCLVAGVVAIRWPVMRWMNVPPAADADARPTAGEPDRRALVRPYRRSKASAIVIASVERSSSWLSEAQQPSPHRRLGRGEGGR